MDILEFNRGTRFNESCVHIDGGIPFTVLRNCLCLLEVEPVLSFWVKVLMSFRYPWQAGSRFDFTSIFSGLVYLTGFLVTVSLIIVLCNTMLVIIIVVLGLRTGRSDSDSIRQGCNSRIGVGLSN